MKRIAMRSCAALSAVLLISISSAAYAHIRVESDDASKGAESAKLAFRVPTESDTASTESVTIKLPKGTPFAYVSPEVKQGWKVALSTTKLEKPAKVGEFTLTKAVTSVTWTAKDSGIPPNQFDEFSLAVGPLPNADSVSFVAVQKYSDGEVVTWDQIQKGDKEPEHPAPTLTLSPATNEGHGHSEEATASESSDDTAKWLSGGALAVALAALVVALRQNRRRA